MSTPSELPGYWDSVIEVLATYIEQGEDHWTLQTEGGIYEFAPYVQGLVEHENLLLVEATSSKFLEPPLTKEQHEVMLFLGWRHFAESVYPNYSQILDRSKVPGREIAQLPAKTLHFAYGVDDSLGLRIVPFRSDAVLPTKEQGEAMIQNDFMLQRISRPYPLGAPVVANSTPIVCFGNPHTSRVATVGINPSRREFEGSPRGTLLSQELKRLRDLTDFGLDAPESISHEQAQEVLRGCFEYFSGPNYLASWFDPLEQAILNPVGASYFGRKTQTAVHLDLVQWATDPVWGQIEDREIASELLEADAGFLEEQLATFDFEYVFLNGKEVCDQVQALGIYQLVQIGELKWKSGGANRTSKIFSARGAKGEIVVGWTLNIQGMKVSNDERNEIYSKLASWIAFCAGKVDEPIAVVKPINLGQENESSVGCEDLAEAYIKTIHYPTVYHPEYWSSFIRLLRAELAIPKGSEKANWLDYVLEEVGMTTHVMPTDGALELSINIPPGAAQDATWQKFSKEIARMRQDQIRINEEYLKVLIREVLGEDAGKRVLMSQLIKAGLPPTEPKWSLEDWVDAY